MKLYEIERSYLHALDMFTDPDHDIPPNVVADTLEAIEGEFDVKAVNVIAYARQLEAEAEAIKDAVERMERRRRALGTRAGWLRDYVKTGMETLGKTKIPCAWFVLAIQKNPASVEVFDEAAIPDEYKTTVTEIRIDKSALKKALGEGLAVAGAALRNGTRLAVR